MATIGLALTLMALGATVASSPGRAVLLVGAVAAVAALVLTARLWPQRLTDLLVLAACALVSLPIDKYFMAGDHIGGWLGYRVAAADLPLVALTPLLALSWATGHTRNVLPGLVLATYAGWLLLSAFSSLGAPRTDYALMELASLLHAVGFALIIGAAFRRRLLRPLLIVIAAAVILQSGFAMAQQVTGRPIGATWFGGSGVVNEQLVSGEVHQRPSGLLDHPIVFANVLILWLPLLLAGLLLAQGWVWRTTFIVALACGGIGLVLTLSRGAWVGMLVAGAAFGVWSTHLALLKARHWRALIAAALVGATIIGATLGPRIYGRLTESQSGNLGVRFDLNWIALRMIEAHPLLGIGLGGFVTRMADFDPSNVKKIFPAPAHNLYLLEAAEVGLPAMVVMAGVFATVLLAGASALSRVTDRAAKWIALSILAGLCGFLVAQLADFSHRLDPLRSIVWMNIGVLFALTHGGSHTSPTATHLDANRIDVKAGQA